MTQPDTTDASDPSDPSDAPEVPEPEPLPLLTLADGLPELTDTPAALHEVCERLRAGTGPIAIDAERASGYRYSGRAYLIQLRRHGSGTALVDPVAFDEPDGVGELADALAGEEWILHAATQDLPCLTEIGLRPTALFDTELAGRLLGYPRVGLATLVETLLGVRMKKEHSAADWSTRPLPRPWLEYAALDVEVLVELRDLIAAELEAAGKAEWARQEFEHLLGFEPAHREEVWRRTSGLHKVRGRRALAAVRALWEARDDVARRRDVSPGRIVPDAALVAAALAMPTDRDTLLAVKGFHGRGAERYAARWVAAIQEALDLPEAQLPARAPRGEGPPVARAWAEKDPVAAERLRLARAAVADLSAEHRVPAENLLTPDTLRRVLWSPPRTREPGALLEGVVEQLQRLGARSWQIGLTASAIVSAILDADAAAAEAAEAARLAREESAAARAAQDDEHPSED